MELSRILKDVAARLDSFKEMFRGDLDEELGEIIDRLNELSRLPGGY